MSNPGLANEFMSPLISNENRPNNFGQAATPSVFHTEKVLQRINIIDKYKLKEIREYTANELFKARAKT